MNTTAQLPPIGNWRTHFSYNYGLKIASNNENVFLATQSNFIQYNLSNNAITKWDKTTGLSNVGLSTISYNDNTKKLIIAYNNSDVDIIDESKIKYNNDLKRNAIIGDKTIYHINNHLGKSYFSTGLGLLEFDSKKNEYGDLFILSNNSQYIPCYSSVVFNDTIFCYSSQGLFKGSLQRNLKNFSNWIPVTSTPVKNIFVFNNSLFITFGSAIYKYQNGSFSIWYDDFNIIQGYHIANNNLYLAQQNNGMGRVVTLNSSAQMVQNISVPNILTHPFDVHFKSGNIFIADQFKGLYVWQNNQLKKISPSGPFINPESEIVFNNEELIACGGSINNNWQYLNSSNGFMFFKNNEWKNYNRLQLSNTVLDSCFDIITTAVDKTNNDIYFGSYGGGLLKLNAAGNLSLLKQNSLLRPAIGDPTSYRVSGLSFDFKNNLWISNFGAPEPLLVKTNNNSWQKFSLPFQIPVNGIHQIVCDAFNNKWIACYNTGGLICYNPGENILNTNDDKWRRFEPNNSNLSGLPQGSEVLSLAIDKENLIWIGTTKGLAYFPCANDAFNTTCKVTQPIINNGTFNGFLLATEKINAVAIDGANRKWVATNNGVWLLSSNGEEVVYRFTAENSSLLDNVVKKIAINSTSGEVFFVTNSGICSFRSTATEPIDAEIEKIKPLIFPNPVAKNYNGTIAIKNLPAEAIVQIIKPNGQLVYQTKSLGGQAVWNGNLPNGQRVAPGNYIILVKQDDNKFYGKATLQMQ